MSSFPNACFLLSLEKDLLKTCEIKDIRVITDGAPSKRNIENFKENVVTEIAYFPNPKVINRDPAFIIPIFCFMIFIMPSFFNLPISAMKVIKTRKVSSYT